jgi:predicted phage terminase large subunit-like protein
LVPEWKQAVLDNPDLFILRYFSHLVDELKDFHLRLIDTATTKKRGLILYPAAHGKTTLVSTLLPIWAICKNPEVRIALITKNDADASGIMRAIQFELMGNEQLIRDFGPFKSPDDDRKAWALTRLDVAKRTKMDKSSTLAAFGSGARTAIGYRTDWTICDDIITDVNSSTPDQRAKVREWFNLGPETMSPHGALTVIGTLFHPEDLYHDLMELKVPTGEDEGRSFYHVQREDAIVAVCKCGHRERAHTHDGEGNCGDCKCPVFTEESEQALWPEERPILWLMERKASMGTLDFNKRYRNIAVDPSRMVFREEYIRGGYIGKTKYPGCLDQNYRIGELEEGWRVYCGFDPAVGITRSRKFCAHLTLAVGSCSEHERCYWVVDLHRDQMTLPQQVRFIIDRHQEYGATKTIVEANSAFAGVQQAVEEEMAERGVQLNIHPHYTTRTNKPDPETGVERMAPWFENGAVHIPWGNQASRGRMKQLVDELIMYPGKFTDTVMATWFAWRESQIAAPLYKSFNRFQNDKRPVLVGHRNLPVGVRIVQNPYYEK